ncbi:MAG: hypothetical protein ACRERC_25055 [Candidatus Binatia bacterium]
MRATLILLPLLFAAPAVAGVTLGASSVTVARPGEIAEICVSLDTGGAEVAGTQNDLVWDGECASLPDASSCVAAGAHGKSLYGHIFALRHFVYRALILSLSDVDPIDDGVLYCCAFTAEAAPGACCPIGLTNAQTSDPFGNSIPTRAINGAVCVALAGPASASPTPTASPTPNVGSSNDDDGCAIVSPAHNRGIWLPLLGALALRLLPRRRT